ncbi:hydroxyisourate hydrolase [Gracilibacillus oryzae]|uniref:5-hydroxyisourate hydrolase n=1 Tax=Gracilibacillus oryzae TaxID=1672701 RepID=A0A7C8KRL2_9BACI|nr:hydroxyisourate hydrolase [Gracilibacillus oryzae]KAB8138214.1 hydroxyisourate hydrolase [Gracilibacillus oryzae]
MAGLTTHVLDLASGVPGANISIDLYRLEEGERTWLKTAVTNQDGRIDQPFLETEAVKTGIYEFMFHIGDYYRAKGEVQHDPYFLEEVPVRFGIHIPYSSYHVPLLITPWGYQVYRGS